MLGDELPLIAGEVTIEQFLAHRSGIGDYLDEDAIHDISDYVMPVSVHGSAQLGSLPVLDGYETCPPPRAVRVQQRRLCRARVVGRTASGVDFHELVHTLVSKPAGMVDTTFLRSDELPGRAAVGYLSDDGLRTNVFHLPVLGNGDEGIYSTAADFSTFWDALFAGRIVSSERVTEMLHPHSNWPEESKRYGLGFHLHATGDAVWLEGYDAGVSFASLHQPSTSITYTVISNWSQGAWPIVQLLDERVGLR